MQSEKRSYLTEEDLIMWEQAYLEESVSSLALLNPEVYPILQNISSAAHWLFWRLVGIRDKKTNVSILKAKDDAEAQKICRGYKELHAARIIIRIRHQGYMLNPNALLPNLNTFPKVSQEWNAIAGNSLTAE
jgi:hypothetical protein